MFGFFLQAFINTARKIYEKIETGVFDVSNEVRAYALTLVEFSIRNVPLCFLFLQRVACGGELWAMVGLPQAFTRRITLRSSLADHADADHFLHLSFNSVAYHLFKPSLTPPCCKSINSISGTPGLQHQAQLLAQVASHLCHFSLPWLRFGHMWP